MVGRMTLRRAAGAALLAVLVWAGGSGAAQAEVPGGLVFGGRAERVHGDDACATAHDLGPSMLPSRSPRMG